MNKLIPPTNLIWEKSWRGWLLSRLYRATWKEIKQIPKDQILLRAITANHIDDDGNIKFKFFQDKTGVSCNLRRFSSDDQARLGIGSPSERPATCGLTEFRVADVIATDVNGRVTHDATDRILGRENYAHCLIWPTDSTKNKLTAGQAKKLVNKVTIKVKVEGR